MESLMNDCNKSLLNIWKGNQNILHFGIVKSYTALPSTFLSVRQGIRYGFYSHAAYTLRRKKVLNKYKQDESYT